MTASRHGHDLVVRGRIVTEEEVFQGSVGISAGKITNVSREDLYGARTLDVRESLVFPGFVDTHVHLREPGWEHKEDFGTGSRAAIHGGVTAVAEMPNVPSPTTSVERVRERRRLASSKSRIPIHFYAGITDENLEELTEELAAQVVGFKAYLAESTGGLRISFSSLPKVSEMARKLSRPVSLHCEDPELNRIGMEKYSGSPKAADYSRARSAESELAALGIALKMKCRVNICHVSTGRAVSEIKRAREEAHVDAVCEVTPHHLFFNFNHLNDAFLKTNPPLRSPEDQDELLNSFRTGQIDILATDHAPHTSSEKEEEFWRAPSGVPGLDDYGKIISWLVVSKGVHPQTILKTCSLNPSNYLGLRDRGRIHTGYGADLSIIDLKRLSKASATRVYSKCGWTPYEGITFPGTCRNTILKGEIASEYDDLFI